MQIPAAPARTLPGNRSLAFLVVAFISGLAGALTDPDPQPVSHHRSAGAAFYGWAGAVAQFWSYHGVLWFAVVMMAAAIACLLRVPEAKVQSCEVAQG